MVSRQTSIFDRISNEASVSAPPESAPPTDAVEADARLVGESAEDENHLSPAVAGPAPRSAAPDPPSKEPAAEVEADSPLIGPPVCPVCGTQADAEGCCECCGWCATRARVAPHLRAADARARACRAEAEASWCADATPTDLHWQACAAVEAGAAECWWVASAVWLLAWVTA